MGAASRTCPNCRKAIPAGAVEFSLCGVVFAKWRPPAPRTALPGPGSGRGQSFRQDG
ncbi:MAG: hypothetical protein HY926_05180 [Elusimicrobia bacterium]|nr:hypothetical protein [Elusimicrobiota bacterium]